MDDEIQLISDGDGLAVIGEPGAVERFLSSEGLESRDLGLQRLPGAVGRAAGVAQLGSEVAANAGRWVQISEKSAGQIRQYGLMTSRSSGLSLGVVQAKGQAAGIKGIVEFTHVPGSLASAVANPAVLAGAAGIMAQMAMQQTMDDIVDYLATIDEKVDDLLRGQKDAVLADMIGVDLVIDEAMTIREQVGRVSEVTWSKVQSTSVTIARTQAYALRQLDALTEKVERKAQMGELAKAAKEAGETVGEWLAVLARCFQLQDAIAVLELDRVLDAAPEELDRHRLALRAARQNRLQLIARSTVQLMDRMSSAAVAANTKVLLHPVTARAVVDASNQVSAGVVEFHGRLGIERGLQSLDAKRWVDAAAEVKDRVLDTSAEGLEAAVRLGSDTLGRATEAFRSVDLDGDGVPDKARALTAVEDAGSFIKGATTGAAGAVGSLFRRKADRDATPAEAGLEQ